MDTWPPKLFTSLRGSWTLPLRTPEGIPVCVCVCVLGCLCCGCLFIFCRFIILQSSLPLNLSQRTHCLHSKAALKIAAVQTSTVSQWTRGNLISKQVQQILMNTIVMLVGFKLQNLMEGLLISFFCLSLVTSHNHLFFFKLPRVVSQTHVF